MHKKLNKILFVSLALIGSAASIMGAASSTVRTEFASLDRFSSLSGLLSRALLGKDKLTPVEFNRLQRFATKTYDQESFNQIARLLFNAVNNEEKALDRARVHQEISTPGTEWNKMLTFKYPDRVVTIPDILKTFAKKSPGDFAAGSSIISSKPVVRVVADQGAQEKLHLRAIEQVQQLAKARAPQMQSTTGEGVDAELVQFLQDVAQLGKRAESILQRIQY